MKTEDFYKRFCEESFDENGVLNAFKPVYQENFNFAYDCVDALAEMEPERKALVWTNDRGEERTFTFQDMSLLSNQAANMFLEHGIEKGDRVMLVLKRHYQFWISMMGLCKIGAIAVPATNLLMEK
ncbi:MAG TPA: AMP-binding protein, partial [Oscillospiraceae bacterium]|nr:AMP-binding protein [Oscillospiraceae bacterium]